MKRRIGPSDLFFPTPAALIVCGAAPDWNIITVAWIGMVDTEKVGVGLLKRQYSLELIRKNSRFTVNIPSANRFRETDYCGMVSGRIVHKFHKTGFTAVPTERTGVPIIQECPLNIECELHQEIELDDLVLLVGRCVETHVDADKSSETASGIEIDCKKMDPIVYFAVANEYWAIGEKLGDAFSAGRQLEDKD
jgi:flavin reductase (DIM6/NTAB) family NADH-FMN oxidoreductase RutF